MLKAARKHQFWRPLFFSAILRRIPPTSRSFLLNHSHHFSLFSSSTLQSSTSFNTAAAASNHFLGNPLKFSGKNFCSEPSRKADNNSKCWNCNSEPQNAPFLVCHSCRAIQPVDHSVDYFQIFGLKKKYEIECENLGGKYKEWQKKLHPDLVHSKSQKEREYAAEQSARVIDAYRSLSNPLSRAIYILKLKGVHVDEEETISEPELLAEIMEIREAVEEAPDSQALNEIRSLMQEKLRHWYNSFSNAFQNQKFEDAKSCVRRMTYYDRVNEEIVKRL